MKLPGFRKKMVVPDSLKDRDNLTSEEFGKTYFGDDVQLEKIAIEFKKHLEKTYHLDLSGLRPNDRLCEILLANQW